MLRHTHYDTLRVPPSATDPEIRDAYRRLAREHHPDRQASAGTSATGSAAGSTSMPAINEAYRVLSDPGRRAMYDAGLRSASSSGGSTDGPSASGTARSDDQPMSSVPVFPSHLGPARIPWRSLLFVGVIAIAGVVILAQFTEPGTPRGPDGIIEIGSCVTIDPNGDAREAACADDPQIDLVVEAFVPFDAECPTGTAPHRDRQGMGVACIGLLDAPAG